MAGHRRISIRLFRLYRDRPELLVALLDIDGDQAAGRVRSARAYAQRWHVRRSTAAEIMAAYLEQIGDLYQGRKAQQDRRQTSLLLPYSGSSGATLGATSESRKRRSNADMRETGSHLASKTGSSPISLKIQETRIQNCAHAREPEPEAGADWRRWRAARLLVPRAQRFATDAIEALASELTPERVEEIIAAEAAARLERNAEDRKRRTVDAMRHEGPRMGRGRA